MKPVEAELIGYEGIDEDDAGDAGGKAQDIDQGIGAVLAEVAPGDPDIASEHGDVVDL
jgi:hypothetical protein